MNPRAALGAAEIAKLRADDVVALWERVQRVKRSRTDPEGQALGRVIIGRALAARRIDPETAQSARAELEEYGLSVLLAGRWRELTPAAVLNRPTVGYYRSAFPRRRNPRQAPDIDQWYRDDPRRLIAYMGEVARFTTDEERVLRVAADFAEQLGIPDPVAEEVLADGLRSVRVSWREKGAGRAS